MKRLGHVASGALTLSSYTSGLLTSMAFTVVFAIAARAHMARSKTVQAEQKANGARTN